MFISLVSFKFRSIGFTVALYRKLIDPPLGCRLNILANKVQSNRRSNPPESFDLFLQGDVINERPFFSMFPVKEGIFLVDYNSCVPLVHAFLICISAIECRSNLEVAAAVPRAETVEKVFEVTKQEEKLLSIWWKEYVECSEGPKGSPASISKSDPLLKQFPLEDSKTGKPCFNKEERLGVPVKGGLYELNVLGSHLDKLIMLNVRRMRCKRIQTQKFWFHS
ncbi:hypothetical protein L1987_43347 [Smallanthus sonchifolius]|uniref:Uncharacterized protein n=1 Tax=Smallanthus sonchifolius TaxID=185202 RepID=A0ACB9GLD2_9ASTR|nr:hypothetical protein L1987_43347 [Smallanthus sonchifolius]